MPAPLLRGTAAVQEGDFTRLFDGGALSNILSSTFGNSSSMTVGEKPEPKFYGEWQFPELPYGVPTTIIPVPFPITRLTTAAPAVAAPTEYAQLTAVFFAAIFLWMLPSLCINKKLCSPCFTRFISKRLFCYFVIGMIINITGISIVISQLPHVSANELFFRIVAIIEKVTDNVEKIMIQLGMVAALVMVYAFRKKIAQILGFDQQLIRCDLRDILTGFSMKRFKAIEVSLWYADGIPSGFTTQTLFCRVLLGYNEPAHTRPHEGIRSQFPIRERLQLNYDPEDRTAKLTITIKQQEFIGTSVNRMLPAAGAVMGGLAGMTTPLGPTAGVAAGVVAGTGAAHSVGVEIARVDLSSEQINRIRDNHNKHGEALHPRPDSERKKLRTSNDHSEAATAKWSEDYFVAVDLIPQGKLWLRIADIKE